MPYPQTPGFRLFLQSLNLPDYIVEGILKHPDVLEEQPHYQPIVQSTGGRYGLVLSPWIVKALEARGVKIEDRHKVGGWVRDS